MINKWIVAGENYHIFTGTEEAIQTVKDNLCQMIPSLKTEIFAGPFDTKEEVVKEVLKYRPKRDGDDKDDILDEGSKFWIIKGTAYIIMSGTKEEVQNDISNPTTEADESGIVSKIVYGPYSKEEEAEAKLAELRS